jgi:FkbM family methyltransferase
MSHYVTNAGFPGFVEKLIRYIPIIYVFFRSIVKYTKYFEEDFNCLPAIFKDKKINIIDVGASDGIASKFFLNNLNVKNIFCFEPQKIFFRELDNFKKKHSKVKVYQFGLGVKKNIQFLYVAYVLFLKKKFYLPSYACAKKKDLLQLIRTNFLISPRIEKIKIRINKFKISKFKIDLIKIDTNGSELEVIFSLQEIIKKNRPVLIIENSNIKSISNYLKKFKYRKYYYYNKNLYPHKNELTPPPINIIFKAD